MTTPIEYLIPGNQGGTKLTRIFKIRLNFMSLIKVQRKCPIPYLT